CFLACTSSYGGAHWLALPHTLAIGLLSALASGALFVCTGMIYICLRFLQVWATPLTRTILVLVGCASGGTRATAGAAWF
ncbi:DMSO reductase, partial [Burkholderia pseudomallei]